MNVGQLRKLLQDLPDNTPVVKPAFDHSYGRVYNAGPATAIAHPDGAMSEDYEDELLEDGDKRINVFLIGG